MFIKLTDYYNKISILLNINNICSIYQPTKNDFTQVTTLTQINSKEYWAVRETPEQIQELIDEQLLKMAKLSKSA